jgi:putative nucleotidyltransferase with HDIG domain
MRKDFIRKIRTIPTLPTIMAQIIQTLDDPRSSASELEMIVRNDQALTTKILAVANSAYYGFRHQITTVRRAVVAIGFDEVRNICLSLSLMGFLHPATFQDVALAEGLWLHALSVSEGAQLVAAAVRKGETSQAFTAGLLHDIGKVILAAFAPSEVRRLDHYVRERGLAYRAAEEELGISHQEVGQALAQHWELPPLLVEVIGRHHAPNRHLTYPEMVAVVHVADYLARDLDMGYSGDPSPPELRVQASELLGLDQSTLAACREQLDQRRDKIKSYMEKITATP